VKATKTNSEIPNNGISSKKLINMLTQWNKHEIKRFNGDKKYTSGAVYHNNKELIELQNIAYSLYSLSNPIHPEIFMFLRKMESEIIHMTLTYFNGNDFNKYCGIVTLGGTESIILAVRGHKNYYNKYKNIIKPEIIIHYSAHCAFDKACELMEIKLIKINNFNNIEKYINRNTILIVGSTPNYPNGNMDDIGYLNKLALKYDIGLHVDCCIGSFLLPTIKHFKDYDEYNEYSQYESIPDFDFKLKGVTSMSVDTHKFGFTPKGSSVVMFNSKELRECVYFCYPNASIGMYATPTLMGSRSGGLIASAWITLMYIGKDGYIKYTKEIMNCVNTVKNAILTDNGIIKKNIQLIGKPVTSILAFKSINDKLKIFKLSDAMNNRGWVFNNLQNPECIHYCFTLANCHKPNKFINDLKHAINEVLTKPELYMKTSGALYGTVVSLPSNATNFKNKLLTTYMDVVYQLF